MAQPIPLALAPRDLQRELNVQLQQAPTKHAQAILAGYEVLQALHDQGVLDVMRGVLGGGEKILEQAEAVESGPEAIRGEIDPALVSDLTRAVPKALVQTNAEEKKPPGVIKLFSTFWRNKDFRRGLAAVNDLLEIFGRSLTGNAPDNKPGNYQGGNHARS